MKKKTFLIVGIILLIVLILTLIIIIINNINTSYKIIKFEYKDSYFLENIKVDKNLLLINNYNEYQNIKNKYSVNYELTENDFIGNSYILYFDETDCDKETEISSLKYSEEKNTLIVNMIYHTICGFCQRHYDAYLYSIEKVNSNIKIDVRYKRNKGEKCDPTVTYKPILYLYPQKDMNINIKFENVSSIITSYPKYNNGWNVQVKRDGTINYNNRDYYALYWDEYNNNKITFEKGFYVTKENAIEFLEEKLDYIGLTNREANEFIMYWLPVLEQNEQSLIYFELTQEREKNNKLIISPKPESLLRINMHIKKIHDIINIEEQELETFSRHGFTAVEWGGTIHKED